MNIKQFFFCGAHFHIYGHRRNRSPITIVRHENDHCATSIEFSLFVKNDEKEKFDFSFVRINRDTMCSMFAERD